MKPKTKSLKNIDLLSELPFYEELNVIKTNSAFRGYGMCYKVELVEKKDPIKQLEGSKLIIKGLFSDLLNETKDFKYQEILCRTHNWTNEGSGWIVELLKSQYINISSYRPLLQSFYIKLPADSRSPKTGLIYIKNNDQKCFLWCHVIYNNPVKIHSERITQKDKKLANYLNYNGIKFPLQEKDFSKLEMKNNLCINVFGLFFPIYLSNQRFENSMVLLLVINENKSHYVYIKDFDKFI